MVTTPPAPRYKAAFGDGTFPPEFLGMGAGPGAGPRHGSGSWLRSPTALHVATKHLQVSGGGEEGKVFVSCQGQHLSGLSEAVTMGGRRLCFSLTTVLPGWVDGTASRRDTEGAEPWAEGHSCSHTVQTLTSCLSISLILRAFIFLFRLQINSQLCPLPFQQPCALLVVPVPSMCQGARSDPGHWHPEGPSWLEPAWGLRLPLAALVTLLCSAHTLPAP